MPRGGKQPGAGRPLGSSKLSPKERADVMRNYVGLCDAADLDDVQLKRPYRDRFVRIVAAWHGISQRMVVSCLVEEGVRRARAKNKQTRKSKVFKRNLKFLQQRRRPKSVTSGRGFD
jgi:hypothetical protein